MEEADNKPKNKICVGCKKDKALDEFGSNKAKSDGKDCYCLVCCRERDKERNKNNHERKLYRSQYRQEHNEERREHNKRNREKWKLKHPEEVAEKERKRIEREKQSELNKIEALESKRRSEEYKQWCKDTKQERKRKRNREYDAERYKNDPDYRIRKSLRSRLREALKGNIKAGPTLKLLGCSAQELRTYLEKQFTGDMTWDNYGTVWVIDHIVPCAHFDLSIPDNQRMGFHYSNLQPLMEQDNEDKRATLPLDYVRGLRIWVDGYGWEVISYAG